MLPVPHGGRQCAEYIERITFLEFLISTDSILLQNQHGIHDTTGKRDTGVESIKNTHVIFLSGLEKASCYHLD